MHALARIVKHIYPSLRELKLTNKQFYIRPKSNKENNNNNKQQQPLPKKKRNNKTNNLNKIKTNYYLQIMTTNVNSLMVC